jgi:uncharacterized protein (DUF1330 family)
MKAYLVLDFSIHDLEGFMPYVETVPTYIARHGGKYIVRGAAPRTIEGDWRPERVVILEFPSRRNAEQFLADPEFKELAKIRHRTTTSKLVLVDGAE